MNEGALVLVATSLIATIGMFVRIAVISLDAPSPCDSGATSSLGDDPVTIAALCGGVQL